LSDTKMFARKSFSRYREEKVTIFIYLIWTKNKHNGLP